jgi:hypothetical protein
MWLWAASVKQLGWHNEHHSYTAPCSLGCLHSTHWWQFYTFPLSEDFFLLTPNIWQYKGNQCPQFPILKNLSVCIKYIVSHWAVRRDTDARNCKPRPSGYQILGICSGFHLFIPVKEHLKETWLPTVYEENVINSVIYILYLPWTWYIFLT